MTIQAAIDYLIVHVRSTLTDDQSNHKIIEACDKLEEIFFKKKKLERFDD